jgi:hypothetical protein
MKKLLLITLLIGAFLLSACDGTPSEPAPTSEVRTSSTPTSQDISDTPTSPPATSTSPSVTPTSPAATQTSPVITDEPPPATEPEQIQASDDSVTIILENIVRADVIPDDIVEALSVGQPYNPPAPAAGCDFFCIYLTIPRIDDIHMIDAFGYGDEETSLFGVAAQKYERITANIKGITFTDPHDITSSYEIAEGATAFWVFEVPKDENPSRFELIYTYKIDIKEETEDRGQIDMIIE